MKPRFLAGSYGFDGRKGERGVDYFRGRKGSVRGQTLALEHTM